MFLVKPYALPLRAYYIIVHKSTTTTYGDRAFSIAVPKLWNDLPAMISNADSIDLFHKWRLLHENEARMLFGQSILVSNYQTDIFLCFIFAKIAK